VLGADLCRGDDFRVGREMTVKFGVATAKAILFDALFSLYMSLSSRRHGRLALDVQHSILPPVQHLVLDNIIVA